jgi:hypothetical protein
MEGLWQSEVSLGRLPTSTLSHNRDLSQPPTHVASDAVEGKGRAAVFVDLDGEIGGDVLSPWRAVVIVDHIVAGSHAIGPKVGVIPRAAARQADDEDTTEVTLTRKLRGLA